MSDQELLYFNGINGATGEYGLSPMSDQEFADLVVKQEKPAEESTSYRPMYGIDEKELAETGWGVLLPYDKDDPRRMARNEAIKEALSELLEHRAGQAGPYYSLFEGPRKEGGGYRRGETKSKFLRRQGVGVGPVDPSKGVPYYLLIVGSPAEIPYRFQNELDVQYAVGRVDFGDDLEAYAHYAHSVVTAEKSAKLPRKVSFFGVANPDDKATALSAQHLVRPLYEKFAAERADWTMEPFLGERATKAQLLRLLGGDQTPAVLFTASHGMEFPKGDSRQIPHQGALLCQDWPGPNEWRQAIPRDHYLAGDDLASDVNLLGLLAFCFACYGAGTPELDEFSRQAFKDREPIAPYPFMAGLPTKMLSRGALAVIGHVERAWGYSFLTPGAGAQITIFEDTIRKLLAGYPVGSALETTNERYAELASELTTAMEEYEHDPDYISPRELAAQWTAHNDARGYVIVGDPAARLPVTVPAAEEAERPVITLKADIQDKLAQFAATIEGPPGEELAESVADIDYRLFRGRDEEDEGEGLVDSFRKVASDLAAALSKALDDVSSLEIMTFTSDDLDGVKYDSEIRQLSGQLRLRALTRISFDGDTQVCLPQRDDGRVDRELWQIHLDMVKEAQANRTELIRTMSDLAARLVGR
jgi:hypothetical protein